MPDFSDWLTVTQAAKLTGAPAYSIRKAIRLGILPARKFSSAYLVTRAAAESWARTRRSPGRPVGS